MLLAVLNNNLFIKINILLALNFTTVLISKKKQFYTDASYTILVFLMILIIQCSSADVFVKLLTLF